MRAFEFFIKEDISQDMKNIKNIRMLNMVLDDDDKALLKQIWNSQNIPIEKKEAYIDMLMDKVNDSQARKDFSRSVGPDVTIPKAKEKVASIGHNQPPQVRPQPQPKSDPNIVRSVRPERTGWEQSAGSGRRGPQGIGSVDTYDAPGVDLDAFPDGQDDYGINTYIDYDGDDDGDRRVTQLQRRSEPLSNFDGPIIGGDDNEQTKDTIHRDLDAFSDLTPDYIEDIETEYQNGANPNEIARTLSQTYGLPIASALKIVDNWVNFSTRRGSGANANAKRIRQMRQIQKNKQDSEVVSELKHITRLANIKNFSD